MRLTGVVLTVLALASVAPASAQSSVSTRGTVSGETIVGGALPGASAERACAAHGPGFALLPGTTTCMRISGSVRAQTVVGGGGSLGGGPVAPGAGGPKR